MTYTGPTLNLIRKSLLLVDLAILVYLFALLVPLLPVQVFIPCDSFSCPPIMYHDKVVPGGFTASYLYSIMRQLTGFGVSYNIDEGYTLPSGIPWNHSLLSDFGVFLFLILPLCLVAVACFATTLLIRRRQKAIFRRYV